jgi:TRAP transporter TAXI family solute receptor
MQHHKSSPDGGPYWVPNVPQVDQKLRPQLDKLTIAVPKLTLLMRGAEAVTVENAVISSKQQSASRQQRFHRAYSLPSAIASLKTVACGSGLPAAVVALLCFAPVLLADPDTQPQSGEVQPMVEKSVGGGVRHEAVRSLPEVRPPVHFMQAPDELYATKPQVTAIAEESDMHVSAAPEVVLFAAPDRINYVMATATLGGTFSEAGISLANLLNTKLSCQPRVGLTPLSTAGTGENMQLLAGGQVQLALVSAYPAKTSPQFSELKHLCSITKLWPNVEHFLIRAEYFDEGDISDLSGLNDQQLYLGARNSGTHASASAILATLDIDTAGKDIDTEDQYSQIAKKLIVGEIEAASLSGGVPVSAVDQVLASLDSDVRILSFTDEQVAALRDRLGSEWHAIEVTSDDYAALREPVRTVAQPVLLIADSQVKPHFVRCLLELLYSDPGTRGPIGRHPALLRLKRENAFSGDMLFPLHQGAREFAAEHGIKVSEKLQSRDGCAASAIESDRAKVPEK